jgi:hypothetical protein
MIDMNKERNEFELYELAKRPCAAPKSLFERFDSNGLGESEQHYVGKYVDSFMQEKWELWLKKANAMAVPQGSVVVTEDQAKDTARLNFMLDDSTKRTVCHQKQWSDDGDLIKEGQCVAEIYYISGWDYMYESISKTKRQAIDKAMVDSGAEA